MIVFHHSIHVVHLYDCCSAISDYRTYGLKKKGDASGPPFFSIYGKGKHFKYFLIEFKSYKKELSKNAFGLVDPGAYFLIMQYYGGKISVGGF